MLRIISFAAVLAVGATVVYAQNLNVIKERRAAMKAVGQAAAEPSKMAKDEAKFDLAKVQAALKVFQEQTKKLPNLYPEDSQKGGNTDDTTTDTTPAVWQKKAEFVAGYDKLNKDAAAAAKAIKDEASHKTEWAKVTSNCGACHKAFRKPK